MASEIRRARLDTGIRVVTESMPDAHSVTIGFWVDAGSRDEDPKLAGVSHFLEHLLFKGTQDRSAQDIAEAVEAVGGEMNAFTTKEYTAFYVRLLDTDLDLGLDILSDIMWVPALREDEIDSERQVVLEEILMHEDEPADLVHDLFTEAMYPGHPLGREILGDETTVNGLDRPLIAGYLDEYYRAPSIVVAVAGNLQHDAVVDGIDRRFRGRTGARPRRTTGSLPPPRPLTVTTRPTEQAHIVLGVPALARDDDDRWAFSVLNQILGGGMSSRLFQEIRERRGLAYSVYSYRCAFAETGALAVYAGTTPARATEVVQLCHAEIDRMADGSVSDRELAVAKGHIKGSLALGLEDSSGRMTRIGRSELIHGEVLSYEELAARTEAVGPDDIRRVAERVLTGPRTLAVVGPFTADTFSEQVA